MRHKSSPVEKTLSKLEALILDKRYDSCLKCLDDCSMLNLSSLPNIPIHMYKACYFYMVSRRRTGRNQTKQNQKKKKSEKSHRPSLGSMPCAHKNCASTSRSRLRERPIWMPPSTGSRPQEQPVQNPVALPACAAHGLRFMNWDHFFIHA